MEEEERREREDDHSNMSGFTSEMEFLNFDPNEDSLDLSLSDGGRNDSGFLSSAASQGSSVWTPPSMTNSNDFDISNDILGDIHLPSLGETGTARKILSQLLGQSGRTSPLKHFDDQPELYMKEGHLALQHLHEDIKNTREKNATLQLEINQLRKQLLTSRDEMEDLDIGENLYARLEKLSPNEMTLREYACLRAATIYIPLRKQNVILERNLQEVQVQLELSNSTIESQAAELSRHRKMSNAALESHRLDLLAAEERGDRLNTRLELEIAKRQERESQAARCDEAIAEAEAMRKETAVLRNTVEEQSRLLQTLTTKERRHRDELADMTKAKDMLSMDKAFLQRELGEVTAAAHEHSRKVESQQMHIDKLEAKILDLTEQLVNVQMATRTAFDERMEKEVNRLRSDYDKDMNSIKDTSKEISDHENRMLREIRQGLERDVEILRAKLNDKESEVNTLTKELAHVRSSGESEVSMLRAEIKMKHFEVTSLGATFEERSSQLKLAQLDLDVLREEVSVHKNALLKMESECETKCSRLEEDLSRAHETIRAYDLLFSDDSNNDCDNMLKDKYRGNAAGGRELNDSGTLSVGSVEDNYSDEDWEHEDKSEMQVDFDDKMQGRKKDKRVSDVLAPHTPAAGNKIVKRHALSVLVSNPRKFRHLLDSAERHIDTIKKLNTTIGELKLKNNQMAKDKKSLKEEISKLMKEISLLPKSNKYIMDLYTQKDDECRHLHKKITTLEEEINDNRSAVDNYLKQNSLLKDKVDALVEERQDYQELKAMLLEFQQQYGDDAVAQLDVVSDVERNKVRYNIREQDVARSTITDVHILQDTPASSQPFAEELVQVPVYREIVDTTGDVKKAQEKEQMPLADRDDLSTPEKMTKLPTSQQLSSKPLTTSSDKLAGLSPMVIKTMVEKSPAHTPIRTSPSDKPHSSAKKARFHVRSPAGK